MRIRKVFSTMAKAMPTETVLLISEILIISSRTSLRTTSAPSPIGLVDMDLDGALDITDVTFLVSLLYSTNDGVQAAVASPAGSTTLSSGAVSDADGGVVQPVIVPTYFLGDSNGDGRVTATDLNHLVAYLYEKIPSTEPTEPC